MKTIKCHEYNYKDVFLKPRKTIVDSRKSCDTSVTFGKHKFILPIYAANMKSVVDENTCEYFAKKNMFYTMHRFNMCPYLFTTLMHDKGFISSISIGVNPDTVSHLSKFKNVEDKPEYITLDIANAWCKKAEYMIKYVRDNFPDSFLIAGNIATKEAAEEIHKWGACAIKAGIAGGHVCITKNKTGFHRPMVSTILDCAEYTEKENIPLIADGGITEHGDIAKALSCGANMVMAGSLFAGYDESAGNIIELNIEGVRPRQYKEYLSLIHI